VRIVLCSLAILWMSGIAAASEGVLSMDGYKSAVCRESNELLRAGCREQIDRLDRKLNLAYREAISFSRNRASLRKQQVRWLKDVRDQTNTLAVAETAFVARVLELQEISIRAIGRRETMMTGVEQREICESVAREASNDTLPDRLLDARQVREASPGATDLAVARELRSRSVQNDRLFSLAVREGQMFPFETVDAGGTCSSSHIARAAPPLDPPSESWPSEEIDPGLYDDEIRWATWGGWESVLMIHGRYFFVTVTSQDNQPGVVTWITPIGTRRPICSLEVKSVERSVRFVREDAALCSAAVRKQIRPIDWVPHPLPHNLTAQERQMLPGVLGAGSPAEQSTVDIDNDGAPEVVGRARHDSGAGCGSTMSYLLLMTADGDDLQAGPLNNSLMELKTRNADPVEVFSFRSHQFVAASLERSPALFRVTSNAVQTECIFHDQPISRIKVLYPLDGVVRNPVRSSRP
jgi:uncharacterized protein YecT (DUF1311 family)